MTERPTVLSYFEEIQHDPLSTPPEIDDLPIVEAVTSVKEWFFENFEDPAQSTPHDSSEGGYLYIWGGPYDTRDIVENVFADAASQEVIDVAIDELDSVSSEWVPSGSRRQPPEEEFYDRSDATRLNALHSEMLRRIAALEEALAHPPQESAGIGHNQPPEPLDPEPIDASDRKEIAAALGALRAQPAEPADEGKAAGLALASLEAKRAKLAEWLAMQGRVFTEEAVKEAGKQFGRWAPPAFWLWIVDLMFGVTQAVGHWLQAIQMPF